MRDSFLFLFIYLKTRPLSSPKPKPKTKPAHHPLRPRDQALGGRDHHPRHALCPPRQQDGGSFKLLSARGAHQLEIQHHEQAGALTFGRPFLRRPQRPGLHLAVQRLDADNHRVHKHSLGFDLGLRDGRVREQDHGRPEDLRATGLAG